MRLVRLAADKPSFRTIEFKPTGLSILVAEQRKPRNNRTGTYNGVGKSLAFSLIHYCLGANKNTAFQRHLQDWRFSLVIQVGGEDWTISRSAGEPNDITLNGRAITLSKLREFLAFHCFDLPAEIPYLTFRSLLPRFIRAGRHAYVSFYYAGAEERTKPYGAMLRNAFLLGLDLQLAQRKFVLRARQEQLGDTMRQLERDPLFADLLQEDTVDIELTALREQAQKLHDDLAGFRVAEDYHAIEKEADEIKHSLDLLRRESLKLTEATRQVEASMEAKPDVPREHVYALYAEANAALPSGVKARIEEVLQFQEELQRRRAHRLAQELQQLQRSRSEIEAQIGERSKAFDEKVRYLSEHRALDEYLAVTQSLSALQQQIAKLEESKAIRERVQRELTRIGRDLAEQDLQTDEYLTRVAPVVEEATRTFRSFAKELYGTRPSGLTISNERGESQVRYRIDAHISADAAEGINEAKIFCYDMSMLVLGRNHHMRCLAHDSTLFGPIDPRQRLSMLRVADQVCRELGFQYFAALNMHDITSLKEQTDIGPAESERLFAQSIVLTLTDESPQHKLLGVDVDMNYEE